MATPYPDPPLNVRQLGSNGSYYTLRLDTYASVPSGPNAGIVYFEKLPYRLTFDVNYNTNAMAIGSTFYRMQPLTATTFNGKRYCGRSRVVSDIAKVKQHEGFSADDHDSHTDVYKRFFLQGVRDSTEKVVAANSALLNPVPVAEAAHRAALAKSAYITDSTVANPYQTDCEFNYDITVRIR